MVGWAMRGQKILHLGTAGSATSVTTLKGRLRSINHASVVLNVIGLLVHAVSNPNSISFARSQNLKLGTMTHVTNPPYLYSLLFRLNCSGRHISFSRRVALTISGLH